MNMGSLLGVTLDSLIDLQMVCNESKKDRSKQLAANCMAQVESVTDYAGGGLDQAHETYGTNLLPNKGASVEADKMESLEDMAT